jgi:serine/threonine protein kinase
VKKIGEGTYGEVLLCREKKTGAIRAVKRIKTDQESDGFPITALREVMLLRGVYHENVVNLIEIVTERPTHENGLKGGTFLVFEYAEHDLTGLCDSDRVKLTPVHIKSFAKQLLQGLFYMHSCKLLHRDIKGQNLLVTKDGVLKICDFGLARKIKTKSKMTARVCTLWYRAPELLMGAKVYGFGIDVWAAGMVLLEMLVGRPIVTGSSEPEQLNMIWDLIGTPTDESWPTVATDCPLWGLMKPLKTVQVGSWRKRSMFR